MKRHDVDMTVGSIPGKLIRFALPLLAGNLFQQLYNMVDTWVIGQTGQSGAYAAVGSVGPIINTLIGFFLGFSSGAGVVISQYYGAKDERNVSRAVHTAMAVTALLSVVFTIAGVLLAPWMLRLMLETGGQSGSDVLPYARTYLTIYFSGVAGLMIYNMGSGILRAVGDSARPFYFLVVSSLLNTVLDLVFVFVFDMGVAGVAYATILSQAVSAVLTVIVLLRTPTCVRLRLRDLRIHRKVLGQIISVGIPSAIQMAITALSNVFVQSYIARADGHAGYTIVGEKDVQTYCLGGWTTYTKIDQFIFLPIQSLSLAATTFVGQNLGVGDERRARRGTYIAYGMATAVTVVVIAAVMLFAPTLAGIFNPDPDVVYFAKLLLRTLTPFYLFPCINQVFSASLRGAGHSRAPMVIMLGTLVVFRQIYLMVISRWVSVDILAMAFSYPVGWMSCSIATLLYFKFANFSGKRLVGQSSAE